MAKRNQFSNFWWREIKETFLCNYIEIGSLAEEEMAFKYFSPFSSGSHLVKPSGTVLAILVWDDKRNIFVKLY